MTFRKVIITVGTGEIPEDGNIVAVRYTAYKRTIRKHTKEQEVYDEEEVDSSVSFGTPNGALYVTLGSTGLLDELNEAIRTMHVGEVSDIFFARHDSSSTNNDSSQNNGSDNMSDITTIARNIQSSPTRNTHMRFRVELLSHEKQPHSIDITNNTTNTNNVTSSPTAPKKNNNIDSENDLPVFDFYKEAIRHKESGNKALIASNQSPNSKSSLTIKEAIAAYRQSIACIKEHERKQKHINKQERDQLHVTVQSNLAQAYIKSSQWNEAIEACKQALLIDPLHTKSLYRLAMSLYEIHNYNECNEKLEQLLTITPDNIDAIKLKAKLNNMDDNSAITNNHNRPDSTQTNDPSSNSGTSNIPDSVSETNPLLSPSTDTNTTDIHTKSDSSNGSSIVRNTSKISPEDDILRRAARKAFATSSSSSNAKDKENGFGGLYADTPTYNKPFVSLAEREKNLRDHYNYSKSWFTWFTDCARDLCCCCLRSSRSKVE